MVPPEYLARKAAHDTAESSGATNAPTRVRSMRNHAKGASTARSTVPFKSLPAYLKDNEFIEGYYRRVLPVRDSFKSLFGIHNETGNIYTHLLGTDAICKFA